MVKMLKTIFCFVITIAISINLASAAYCTGNDKVFDYIGSIFEVQDGKSLFQTQKFLDTMGKTEGDWFTLAASRYIGSNITEAESQQALNAIKAYVEDKYKKNGTLDNSRATEWHRISLAILSLGGDPEKLCTDEDGLPINLIADGVYARDDDSQLGKQGVTGFIWGLIALEASGAEVPEGSYYWSGNLIEELLSYELENGGFNLMGTAPDADVTALAVTALAPHYNEKDIYYNYENKNTKKFTSKKAKAVIDKCLDILSELQNDDGSFSSFGESNCESTSQVLIALYSLGINPEKDQRFIKNGKSALDALASFRITDGGFAHISDDSGSGKSNLIATQQAVCALAAKSRFEKGETPLYVFKNDEVIVGTSPEIGDSSLDLSSQPVSDPEMTSVDYIICIVLVVLGVALIVAGTVFVTKRHNKDNE